MFLLHEFIHAIFYPKEAEKSLTKSGSLVELHQTIIRIYGEYTVMNHYKSWSALNKQLTNLLCDEFKKHISFFLTRYHKVHNSYGRAAIRFDDKEMVCFSWIEMYHQENDLHEVWEETGIWNDEDPDLKDKWDANANYCDMDFLSAAASFLEIPINEALNSDNYIIKIFAILDRRVGKRTLQKIKEKEDYQTFPDWVKQFYVLRLDLN